MGLITVYTYKEGREDYWTMEKIGRKYPDWSTKKKNTEKTIRDIWDTVKTFHICVFRVLEEKCDRTNKLKNIG